VRRIYGEGIATFETTVPRHPGREVAARPPLDRRDQQRGRRLDRHQPLHHSAGYRTVGVRERIAQLDGTWHDTVLIERRSPVN
jgi:hypothetical protein